MEPGGFSLRGFRGFISEAFGHMTDCYSVEGDSWVVISGSQHSYSRVYVGCFGHAPYAVLIYGYRAEHGVRELNRE